MVFVGEERREIVADLVTAFDEIKGGGTSRLVTLVSMPGWGKTRIIQEFYSSLALEQNEPHYWPDSLVVIEDGEEGILGARKLVHPAHMTERPDGAALDYMWWGISCKKDPNSSNLEEVLDRAAEQVANHALGRQSLEELKGEFLGASVDLSTNLLSVLGLVGLVVFPPLGAAGTIVGAAKFAWDRREAFQRTKTALAERRAKGRPIDLATSREEADDQLVRFLTRWSAKVPMVIVLDDAQWATERTISVLNQLLTSNESRVLIVATTWPHEVSTINALGGHAHHFQERWADWQQRLPERVSQVVLEPFNDADAGELFDAELPGVDSVTKAKVLARVDHNPLVLRLCLRVFGEEIQSGDFNEDLIPNSVEDAFRLIWKEFPKPIQQFLALAAHLGQDYFVDLLDEVTTATLSEGARKLATKSAELNWVKSIDEILQSFGEVTLFDITVSSDAYKKATKDHKILRAGLQTFTSSEDFEALSKQANMIVWGQQLRLAIDYDDLDSTKAARVALKLAEAHTSTFEYYLAITVVHHSRKLAEATSELGLTIRATAAMYLSEMGCLNEALEMQQHLIVDYELVLGIDHPATLWGRNNLGNTLRDLGKHNEALELERKLLDDRIRLLGADHPDTLVSRSNLGITLGVLGRLEEALEMRRQLLDDRLRLLGPEHPDALWSRLGVAATLGGLGRLEDSLEMTFQVIADYVRILGIDNPSTLWSRSVLSSTLRALGRLDEALEAECELLEDRVRILGTDHPATFESRTNLATTLRALGRLDEALEIQQQVLKDRLHVFGAEHPGTLWARNNLAITLKDLGRLDEALEIHHQLLQDRLRTFGANHSATQASKENLSITLKDLGRLDEALEIQQQVLEYRLRTLGADNLGTFRIRHNLAITVNKLGRLNEALEMERELLEDRFRILGADHPHTLMSRNNLAVTLKDLGRLEEACEIHQLLLEDRLRILGAEHPDTLSSRNNLAVTLKDLGRLEDCLEMERDLLKERLRILGADHPHTLMSRNHLAITVRDLGRLTEAEAMLEDLLGDCWRVLSDQHPLTKGIIETLNHLRS